jgi:hypothetical protein
MARKTLDTTPPRALLPGTPVQFTPAAGNMTAKPPRAAAARKGAKAQTAVQETPAKTVIYVHGIGRKPKPDVLHCQWDHALFGQRMGERTRLAYWANVARHGYDLEANCDSADTLTRALKEGGGGAKALRSVLDSAPRGELREAVEELTDDPSVRDYLLRLGRSLDSSKAAGGIGTKGIGDWFGRLTTRLATRMFLADVHDFFFVEERRTYMRERLLERLEPGGGPFVIVAHSQGSMIAYDVLRALTRAQCEVKLLLTIGSPLGNPFVKSVFEKWTGKNDLPYPECVERWINIADDDDIVAVDETLNDDVKPKGKVTDIHGKRLNLDAPEDTHSGTGYLRTEHARVAVRDAVGQNFAQAVTRSVIASDLARTMEAAPPAEREAVLIELTCEREGDPDFKPDLDRARREIRARIEALAKQRGDDPKHCQIDDMARYVGALLTRFEIEALRAAHEDLSIHRLWRDAAKRVLIADSAVTIQAAPAQRAYRAEGERQCWAIIDTGINAAHPHFQTYANVQAMWDCTKTGAPQEIGPTDKRWATLDDHGHGTHVAGILAGVTMARPSAKETPREYYGMAPRAKLMGFKVLDKDGDGNDSWIIKALDKIAELNERAGKLVVHGVNLSLGGNFDPSVYGCGHTPVCNELRRLWRQGVLVCLAAGNEGWALLNTAHGDIAQANMDCSIGDPANLDEAIAVGSVHKRNPHTYGVSYFSSRGPTADGRMKPDVVAPGEKILSARHDFRQRAGKLAPLVREVLVEQSGTSMATPHVAGLLAAFLSVRTEFIGYPDRVKEILLANCTDLRRDRYAQGAGMPNLVKMLATT